MEWNNKTRTCAYLTGRFFDGISSGLFMRGGGGGMLSTPNMGAFVAMVALACTAASFVLTPFFSTLIDRFSRKRLLVLVQWLQASTAGVVALVYWAGYESNGLLAVAQLLFWTS
ncbi:MFS transporter, partial [Vibrio alginolyticus]|nr:MFS transporter [Vibrio alginolyticus]